MSSIARKSNTMNIEKIALMFFFLLLIYPVLAIAYSDTNLSSNPGIESSNSVGATLAYLGDARPSKFGTVGITELTRDLNQVIPQSPTGRVDAIIMIGDMDKISQTKTAYAASNVTDIPIFYVVGNHEVGTSGDVDAIRAMYANSIIPLTPGPAGTDKTTYSFDVGEIHIVNINEYWNGANNDAWFKYGNGEGGYIPDALYNWISNDLSRASNPWKIVVGHEPLYPRSRHVGDSLDKDPANRNKLQDLFVSQNVAVFVGAHTHFATVNTVGGVYHVDAGVSGQKTVDGEDPYTSIIYTHIDAANDLILTWKHENPTWDTPITRSYTISKTISSTNPPLNITSYSPISPIIDNEGATQTFNVEFNQTVDLVWYINGIQVSSNSRVIAANYTNTSAKSGTWELSAVANNSNGSVVQTWIWNVSDPLISGSFINGTIMDSVSKSGLAGVEVLTDTGLSTKTNSNGFYSFEVTQGTYTIIATFEPAYYSNSTTLSITTGAFMEQDIELLKKLNGTIMGRVNYS
ncbi:MAG: metallophosphoesterase [Candidatus Methanoperedens sp.]|nr:metallophosphoesterase [Candidatus Methanoperedens sp.]